MVDNKVEQTDKYMLKQQIKKLKKELSTYSNRNAYSQPDIVAISVKLDKVLNEYMKR